jgi:hypothetical protein
LAVILVCEDVSTCMHLRIDCKLELVLMLLWGYLECGYSQVQSRNDHTAIGFSI